MFHLPAAIGSLACSEAATSDGDRRPLRRRPTMKKKKTTTTARRMVRSVRVGLVPQPQQEAHGISRGLSMARACRLR